MKITLKIPRKMKRCKKSVRAVFVSGALSALLPGEVMASHAFITRIMIGVEGN